MRKFDNYVSNLRVLERADKEMLSNEFIISGIIDKFCIQFELGWKFLKELLAYEGIAVSATGSPRSIIKEAYAVYPFFDGELWLKMLRGMIWLIFMMEMPQRNWWGGFFKVIFLNSRR